MITLRLGITQYLKGNNNEVLYTKENIQGKEMNYSSYDGMMNLTAAVNYTYPCKIEKRSFLGRQC